MLGFSQPAVNSVPNFELMDKFSRRAVLFNVAPVLFFAIVGVLLLIATKKDKPEKEAPVLMVTGKASLGIAFLFFVWNIYQINR